jgi:hypothetical protein
MDLIKCGTPFLEPVYQGRRGIRLLLYYLHLLCVHTTAMHLELDRAVAIGFVAKFCEEWIQTR